MVAVFIESHAALACRVLLGALVCLALVAPARAAASPHVVASIAPIHSLVAQVMASVAEPALIVPPNVSPHGFALRPSTALALYAADLVVWIGPGFETFLADDVADLAPRADSLELIEVAGMTTWPVREGGAWPVDEDHGEHEEGEDHAEDGGHDEHEDGIDPHVWLDPVNAQAMTRAIAASLAALDPERAAIYAANAEATIARIAALDGELRAQLAPIADRPFIVFHDAYQYLERRYGLNGVGALGLHPELAPSARDMVELKSRIDTHASMCVFREPQFDDALVASLVEGTDALTGTLDPEGGGAPGTALYGRLMRVLGRALADCLARIPST
jgi:zinc transport system substrate-binding protein